MTIHIAEVGNNLTVVASLLATGCLTSWIISTNLPDKYRRVVIALIIVFIATAIEGAFWSLAYHFSPPSLPYHPGITQWKDELSISVGLLFTYATIEFINLAYSLKHYQKWLIAFCITTISITIALVPPPIAL